MNQDLQPALDLIKSFEGCRLTAYQDIVGVWTIGWGTTGPWVTEGDSLSQESADDLLYGSVQALGDEVTSACAHPLTNNQLCALISFAYNLGINNLHGSTLLRKLNAGNTDGAADEFLKWNNAGGKVIKGLTLRREAERELFLKPEN